MQRLNAKLCIFALVLALTATGILTIYSSSAVVAASRVNRVRSRQLRLGETFRPVNHHSLYLRKQIVWCALGLTALMFFYASDYNKVLHRSKWLLLLSLILLGAVYIPNLGLQINGARRWIRLGPMTFQPSELAKLALVIVTAKMLNDRREQLYSFARGLLPPLLLVTPIVAIIAVEDLGTAIVIALIVGTLWFIAGIRLRHLLALAPAGLAALALGVLVEPYRRERVINFVKAILDREDLKELLSSSWQPQQALIAVGTGGWSGLGLGAGIQKHHFVAAMYTDFAFANLCEELGFIRVVALLGLFAALFIIGFRVAYKSPDFVGALLAAGMTTMIAVPVLINVAVVLRCLPAKGLALPFISYGGSSLLINMSAVGLLMNIARRNEQTQQARRPVAVTPERRLWRWGRTGEAY